MGNSSFKTVKEGMFPFFECSLYISVSNRINTTGILYVLTVYKPTLHYNSEYLRY